MKYPGYAGLGLGLLVGCTRSAFELMTSEAHRAAYHVAHGDTIMDLDVIADEYLHWPLERVAGLYLIVCLLTPVVALLAYRFGVWIARCDPCDLRAAGRRSGAGPVRSA